MKKSTLIIILDAILLILLAIFSVQNSGFVTLKFFKMEIHQSLSLIMVFTFVMGGFTTFILLKIRETKSKHQDKKEADKKTVEENQEPTDTDSPTEA